jgi:hypothetical protein
MNDRAYDMAAMMVATVHALEVIQRLTHLGGDKAADALKAIDAIVTSIGHGFEGKTTPDVIVGEINAFRQQLVDNDVAADAALAAKFPTGTPK